MKGEGGRRWWVRYGEGENGVGVGMDEETSTISILLWCISLICKLSDHINANEAIAAERKHEKSCKLF
jgi:hypothetical protein